jgi:hypothetical protein
MPLSFIRWSHIMKRYTLLGLMILLFIGCTTNLPSKPPDTTTTVQVNTAYPTAERTTWSVYDPDADHLWNRVFRQLYQRVAANGEEYGSYELDPLLWPDTTYLLDGQSYQKAVQLLDEFLSSKGEDLISDPLKRAMFQQDLWAVFDWLTFGYSSYPSDHSAQRKELEYRIAQVIQRVALSKEEILDLPENYTAAVHSRSFPLYFQSNQPSVPFLPADFYLPDSNWVCLGRQGGPIAIAHTQGFPFLGRSVFLVYIRVPGGKDATLSFVYALMTQSSPNLPDDMEVALVRRALLIDKEGEIILSPLVLSVQVRHFKTDEAQFFYEYQTSRPLLFANVSGGFQPVDKEIMLFSSHGDEFQFGNGDIQEAKIPSACLGCHIDELQGISGITSILSYSRKRFPLPGNEKPILVETTPEFEAQTVITWKQNHQTWQALETFTNKLH